MTLVVAYASREIGFIVADTLLSSPAPLRGEEGPVNGASHALKVHILSGHVAVAFAGDPQLACALIAEVKANIEQTSGIDIAAFLHTSYLARVSQGVDERRSDFLVLRLVGQEKVLEKVTLEAGIQRVEIAYIGDANGYRELMQLIAPYSGPRIRVVQLDDGSFDWGPFEAADGEQLFSVLSDAMEALCHRRSVATVGAISDAITRVVDARISGELEYLQAVVAGRSVEEGATGYTLLAANVGARAMAIYFYAGRLGFVFLPGDPAGCQRLDAASDHAFIAEARSRYGIELTGPTTSAS